MAEHKEVKTEPENDKAKFMRWYQEGDMKSVSELYTEDCALMPPGMEVQRGRKAVEGVLRAMKAKGVAKLDVKTEQVSLGGEYGWRTGRYKMFTEDGSCCDTGKSLVVLKKVNGVYFIHNDIFNSNEKAQMSVV